MIKWRAKDRGDHAVILEDGSDELICRANNFWAEQVARMHNEAVLRDIKALRARNAVLRRRAECAERALRNIREFIDDAEADDA